MKYLFVIYTDLEYNKHLDNFKTQEFYKQICDDPNIEVMEWGSDFHTDYKDLPSKTQKMMKWCSENKEYDYLIKCDDTIFEDKWNFYEPKLTYENIFVNGRDGNSYSCPSYGHDGGEWIVVGKDTNKDYWGINCLQLGEEDWKNYVKSHDDIEKLDFGFIKNDIPFFEGKFYVVSKDFSIFIGGQESFAKEYQKNMPGIEDFMVGYLAELF